MSKTKIIQIISRLDRGGSPRILLSLARHLSKEKYEIKIITGWTQLPEGDLKSYSLNTGIDIIYVNQLRRNINLILDLIAFFRLYSIIKRENPIIVHTHTSKAGILGRWAARLAGTPIIIHMPHGHVFYGYFGRLKTSLFVFLEKITAFITDKIITLTEIGKTEHIKFGIAPEDKFISIHNGIDLKQNLRQELDTSTKRRQLGFQDKDYLIAVVARLERVKGHIYFLRAMRQIVKQSPEAKALIVGDGTLRQRLEDMVDKLDISNSVKFLGERDNVFEIISVSDLIVLPSLNEGFGLILLEAGILGKPVVATNVGGIPEVILDKKTGILVPPKDSKALEDAVIRLLRKGELYNSISKEARVRISKFFSSDLMLRRFEALYDDLLSQKK